MKYAMKICSIIKLLSLALISTTASAEDWSFVSRIGIGIMDYSLAVPPRSVVVQGVEMVSEDAEFNASLKFVGLGATVLKDRFYLDLYGQISDNDNSAGTTEVIMPGSGLFEKQKLNEREDYSITVGYRVTDFANIYAGYRVGKTSFGRGTLGTRFNFDEEGFFLGGTLLWPILDAGVIAINLAVAELDSDSDIDVAGAEAFNDSFTASTTGLSYGISWNSRFTDKLSYSIAFDGYEYTFDDADADNSELLGSAEEEIFTLRINLSYEFD